jgi:hypothetical protein
VSVDECIRKRITENMIKRIQSCRVWSLAAITRQFLPSMGIPAVGLASSAYYEDKFLVL